MQNPFAEGVWGTRSSSPNGGFEGQTPQARFVLARVTFEAIAPIATQEGIVAVAIP